MLSLILSLKSEFRADILFSNNFIILIQISFLLLKSYTKSLEREKPKLSGTKCWNLSKGFPKFFKSSFCSKKEVQMGPTFAPANIPTALFLYISYILFSKKRNNKLLISVYRLKEVLNSIGGYHCIDNDTLYMIVWLF